MTHQQLIDGAWVAAGNGATWDVINPATETVVETVPFGDRTDCRRAIDAAGPRGVAVSSQGLHVVDSRAVTLYQLPSLVPVHARAPPEGLVPRFSHAPPVQGTRQTLVTQSDRKSVV